MLLRWCTSLHHVMIWIDLVLFSVLLHVNLIWWLLLVLWQIKWLQHWEEFTIKCHPHDMSFPWAHVLMGVVIITTGESKKLYVLTLIQFLVIPLSEVLIELYQLMFTSLDAHHPLKLFSMAFFFFRWFYKWNSFGTLLTYFFRKRSVVLTMFVTGIEINHNISSDGVKQWLKPSKSPVLEWIKPTVISVVTVQNPNLLNKYSCSIIVTVYKARSKRSFRFKVSQSWTHGHPSS